MIEWHIWYGLKIGLSYEWIYTMPFGELCDLIAVEQIKQEGAKRRHTAEETEAAETAEFWRLMRFV